MDNDLKLLSNGNFEPMYFVTYKRKYYGLLIDIFRTRERLYILYSFLCFLFFSLGFVSVDFLPYFSLLDKLSHLFNISLASALFYELFFISFLIFLFSFTIYSFFINFLVIAFFCFDLGFHCISFFNNSFINPIFMLSLFSFIFVLYLGESLYFSRSINIGGLNFSRISEILSFSLFFILYCTFTIFLFYIFYIN